MNPFEFRPEGIDEQEFEQAEDLVHSRQRFRRKEKSASYVLNQLLARKGYLQQKSSNELSDVWNEVIETRWQTKTKIGNISRGVLEVIVQNSAVSQHLNFQKQALLKKLQQMLPQNKIKDIRFRIGSF